MWMFFWFACSYRIAEFIAPTVWGFAFVANSLPLTIKLDCHVDTLLAMTLLTTSLVRETCQGRTHPVMYVFQTF